MMRDNEIHPRSERTRQATSIGTLPCQWIVAGIVLFMGFSGAARAQPVDLPNIVLCMADDQGWGDVGYAGHPILKTPNLDAMAAAGLRMDRFYAAAPVCTPTRGSVLTGRHPNRFGCFKWGHTLRPQEITIAEALKPLGYATGHFGKWHLGSVRSGSPVNPGASGFDRWISAPNFYDNDAVMSDQGNAVAKHGESSMIATEAAIDFIRQSVSDKRPFFAVVWFGSPHGPHRASPEHFAAYETHGEKRANFYGEIAGIDQAVGELRTALRDLKIEENTIFWYCSDNGGLPNLGVTGGRRHKGSIYEGGLRVPSIIEWPARIREGRITQVLGNTVDIYPTLLDVVNHSLRHQPPLDGESLLPLIDDRMTQRSRPIGFWDYPAKGIGTPSAQWMAQLREAQRNGDQTGKLERLRLDAAEISPIYPTDSFPGHVAWLDWPWKLHRIEPKATDDLASGDVEVRFELYHLGDDPDEKHDLAASDQPRLTAMQRDLNEWLVSVVHSLNGGDYHQDDQ